MYDWCVFSNSTNRDWYNMGCDDSLRRRKEVKTMNKGMKRLLEKYGDIIESIHREYNDGLDYWVYLKDGYICPEMECGTIHEYNLKDIERQLKTVIKG